MFFKKFILPRIIWRNIHNNRWKPNVTHCFKAGKSKSGLLFLADSHHFIILRWNLHFYQNLNGRFNVGELISFGVSQTCREITELIFLPLFWIHNVFCIWQAENESGKFFATNTNSSWLFNQTIKLPFCSEHFGDVEPTTVLLETFFKLLH